MPTVKIKGMRCGHCVSSVTKALNNIDGVSNVEVSLEKNQVTYNESKPVPKEVISEAIEKIGFEVE